MTNQLTHCAYCEEPLEMGETALHAACHDEIITDGYVFASQSGMLRVRVLAGSAENNGDEESKAVCPPVLVGKVHVGGR